MTAPAEISTNKDLKDNTEALNPLLARVTLPGSTFQLPSRGLFYKNNELAPNVKLGELHIHAMSAYDEILMKTPDSLFSGEAVNVVFKRCIPQILKPTELLAKDVDFLLVCLRKITYGDSLEVNYNHGCEDAKTHTYTVNTDDFLNNARRIDPTTVGQIYTKKLSNGQIVKLKPTTFNNLIRMYQDSDPMKQLSPEEELNMTSFVISSVIESVDEISDQKLIEEWVKNISAGWIGELSDTIEKTSNFGPEFKFETKCKDCGKTVTIETPINPVSFFL